MATTAWVKDETSSIPSGNVAVYSRDFTWYVDGRALYINAPSGGTWFCWGLGKALTFSRTYSEGIYGTVAGGGSQVIRVNSDTANVTSGDVSCMMAIKIA